MAKMSLAWLRLTGIVGGALLAGGVVGGAAVAYQPHMVTALHYLQLAHTQLELAIPDKGGYRTQALGLVNQAIGSVNAGIAAAR